MYGSPARAAVRCWFIGRSLSDSLAIWVPPLLWALASVVGQLAGNASGFGWIRWFLPSLLRSTLHRRNTLRGLAPITNLSAPCQELRQSVPRFPFRYFFSFGFLPVDVVASVARCAIEGCVRLSPMPHWLKKLLPISMISRWSGAITVCQPSDYSLPSMGDRAKKNGEPNKSLDATRPPPPPFFP